MKYAHVEIEENDINCVFTKKQPFDFGERPLQS